MSPKKIKIKIRGQSKENKVSVQRSSKTLRLPASLCSVTPGNVLAVHFDQPGGPENLYLEEVAKPRPGEGEVLLKVAASTLSWAHILQVLRDQGGTPEPSVSIQADKE